MALDVRPGGVRGSLIIRVIIWGLQMSHAQNDASLSVTVLDRHCPAWIYAANAVKTS